MINDQTFKLDLPDAGKSIERRPTPKVRLPCLSLCRYLAWECHLAQPDKLICQQRPVFGRTFLAEPDESFDQ